MLTIDSNGVVHEHQEFANSSVGGKQNQTFRYDAAKGTWSVKDLGPFGTFTGNVDSASNKLIEMTGLQKGVPTRERLIFASPSNFVRLWENRPKTNWVFLSYSDCTLQKR